MLLAGGLALVWASGVAFWLALGAATVGLAGAVMPAGRGRFDHVALVAGSVFVGLAMFEAGLWVLEQVASKPLPAFVAKPGALPLAPELPPEIWARILRMQSALVMPSDWQKRDLAKIPGTHPFVWQGVVHQIDGNGMRRDEPFPPRDPSRFRIVVVGDEGVDAYWAYPAQLERALAAELQVEVLNLGVRGYTSEHVLNVVRRFVPELEPDLVMYGVCLNDFLEAGATQPKPPLLLPKKLTKILTRRTPVGRLVNDQAAALKRRLGLEPDFYSQLLADFDDRSRRFGEDVAAMNAFVMASGLPPMIAMVLDQNPRLDGTGRQLAVAAEHQLHAGGIEVLDSEEFYRRYDGRSFRANRWEGHPNEEAHAIWAARLARSFRDRPDLARFGRTSRSPPATGRPTTVGTKTVP